MIVYLAGFKTIEKTWNKPTNDIHLLSSFWEHKNGKFGIIKSSLLYCF